MALQKREKVLAITTVGLLAVFLVWMLFSSDSGTTLAGLRESRDNLTAEVERKEKLVGPGKKAIALLAELQRRSLPSNHDVARSLYKNWLDELADRAKLRNVTVGTNDPTPNRGIFHSFVLSIHCQGTLDEVTRFLFDFHSAGHLQKIRRLSVDPMKDSDDLSLVFSIEALSLPSADNVDELSSETSAVLALASLDEYRDVIVKRKLEKGQDGKEERILDAGGLFAAFVPYKPPPPPPPKVEEKPEPKPPEFDVAAQTYVNGITEANGQPEVWLFVRTEGELLRRCQGETFQVGPAQGTVGRIGRREVEVEISGKRRLLALGDNLNEGKELAVDPPPAPADDAADNSAAPLAGDAADDAAEPPAPDTADASPDDLVEDSPDDSQDKPPVVPSEEEVPTAGGS